MDKLLIGLEVQLVEFLLEEIFDRLYIVVGDRLNRLYPGGIVLGKVLIDCPQGREEVAQSDKVLNLDPYPVPDKSPLRKIERQIFHLVAVAAIDRRYSRE